MILVDDFGRWWLSGPKYDLSARLAGEAWNVTASAALTNRGRALVGCHDIHDVVRLFRGKEFWRRDGFYALQDTVLPPELLLTAGGDDCDGWAMMHTQAVNQALGHLGWAARTVTYLANPWWMSHHFCAATAPDGKVWAIQPQPTEDQWRQYGEACQTVYGPFPTVEAALEAIATQYHSSAVWWDQRDGMYRPIG